MANTIKLKNGSGNNPSASDLVVGEVALRTDGNPKLFTKNDAGNVLEVGLVESGSIIAGSIVNADINASAAISGTKISPSFGSQNISTTGGLLIGDTSAMNANFGSGTHGVVEVAGSSGGELVLRRDDTSIGSGNSLGRIEAMGNDPNGNEERVGGVIAFSCPSGRTWNDDDYPTNISFATCKDGSGTRTTSLFLNAALGNKKHNVLVGSASGSNMDDYYLGIRGNENSSDGDSTNIVNFGILNQSQNASAQAHIDFRLGQASVSNTCGVRLISGKMSGWNNTTSTRDGYFKIQVANNATLTTRLYINNAGRVGIGNIAPSETLDVTGSIAVSGTVDGVDIAARNTLFGGLTSSLGVLTNGVTATTQSAGDNSTKVATTAYTDTAISNLVDSSPSTLNTLNELAAALGDDANFSTTVTNSIATKLPLAGGTLTGDTTISKSGNPTFSIISTTLGGVPKIRLRDGYNRDNFIAIDDNGDNLIIAVDEGSNGDASTIRHRIDGVEVSRITRTQNTSTITHALVGNVDISSGLDVTGGITASSTGNASLILDAGTGSQAGNQVSFIDFKLDGTLKANIAVNEATSGNPLEINSAGTGATKLFNAGSEKLSTSSSGVSITGTCTATTFSGSGASLTNIPAGQLTGTLPALDGSNLTGIVASGSNADTLDNLDSTQFLRSDQNDTINGILTVGGSSVSGGEGGEINLTVPATTNLSAGAVALDIQTNTFRIFETGGNNRGFYLDLTTAPNSAAGKIFHSGNDGPGSGLDADTLDGVQGASYLRSDADDTASGKLTFTDYLTLEDTYLRVGDVSGDNWLKLLQATSDGYGFDWQHNNASVIVNEQGSTNEVLVLGDVDADDTKSGLFGIAHSQDGGSSWTKKLDLRGNGALYVGSSAQHKVFHEGNLTEGDGGLTTNNFTNADHSKLDGIESGATADQTASEILTLIKTVDGTGSGLDADTLDGAQGSQFLRSDSTDTCTGQITFTGQILSRQDGNKATQGGNALILQHNSTPALRANHFIHDDFPSGSGTYYIQVTESGVTNDRNMCLQGYGGKVKIGGSGTAPTTTLDVEGTFKVSSTSTFSNDATFNGGAGAVTVAAASDIRIAGGTWTGEYTGGIKIQPDGSNSYIQYQGVLYFRDEGSTNNFQLTQNGGLTITGSVTANGGFSGSGANLSSVNAATLDNLDSTQFLRSDANDTTTGNLSIVKTEPTLTLKDSNTTNSEHPTINFDTNNNQGVKLYHSEFDSGLPQAGYGLVLTGSASNTQFPNTGVCQLVVLGAIYTGSSSMGSVEKVDAFPSGTRMIFQQTSAPTGWTKDTTDTNQRALRVVSGSVSSGGNLDFTSAFASRGVGGSIGNTTQGGTIADGGNNTNNASISTNNKTSYSTNNATQGGSIGNGGNNTNNASISTNSSSISISVNNHTLSTNQMPTHRHTVKTTNSDSNSTGSQGYPANDNHSCPRTTDRSRNRNINSNTLLNAGSSSSHNHGLSQSSHSHSINNHSHSINAHNHSFSGSAHSHSMPNHNHSIDDHNHSIDDHNHSFTGSAHNHTFSGTSINLAVRYLDVIIASKD